MTRRRRAEQALISVVATSYLRGVSTRRVDRLVEQLGVAHISKSQVSELARHLDGQVEAFRSRPLDAGPYRFVQADALTMKVREDGRVINVHCLLAVGVNGDGHREILGLDVVSSEDGAGWLAFFRGLVARGLTGVRLVTSDAHAGLVASIGATSQPWVATLVRTIFDQADATEVNAQFDRAVDGLAEKLPRAATHLEEAKADVLAFTTYPREIWRQIWSSNPQERLNKEIRRRTDVVGIFPNREAIIRPVGAVLAEQHDEWIETHRYFGLEILAKTDPNENPADTPEISVTTDALAA